MAKSTLDQLIRLQPKQEWHGWLEENKKPRAYFFGHIMSFEKIKGDFNQNTSGKSQITLAQAVQEAYTNFKRDLNEKSR